MLLLVIVSIFSWRLGLLLGKLILLILSLLGPHWSWILIIKLLFSPRLRNNLGRCHHFALLDEIRLIAQIYLDWQSIVSPATSLLFRIGHSCSLRWQKASFLRPRLQKLQLLTCHRFLRKKYREPVLLAFTTIILLLFPKTSIMMLMMMTWSATLRLGRSDRNRHTCLTYKALLLIPFNIIRHARQTCIQLSLSLSLSTCSLRKQSIQSLTMVSISWGTHTNAYAFWLLLLLVWATSVIRHIRCLSSSHHHHWQCRRCCCCRFIWLFIKSACTWLCRLTIENTTIFKVMMIDVWWGVCCVLLLEMLWRNGDDAWARLWLLRLLVWVTAFAFALMIVAVDLLLWDWSFDLG